LNEQISPSFTVCQPCLILFKQFRQVHSDAIFEFAGFGVEGFQFLVEFLQLLRENEIVGRTFADADVPARIQRPALCLNFLRRRRVAQPGNVAVSELRENCKSRSLSSCNG
jgi:hypothetical protein